MISDEEVNAAWGEALTRVPELVDGAVAHMKAAAAASRGEFPGAPPRWWCSNMECTSSGPLPAPASCAREGCPGHPVSPECGALGCTLRMGHGGYWHSDGRLRWPIGGLDAAGFKASQERRIAGGEVAP